MAGPPWLPVATTQNENFKPTQLSSSLSMEVSHNLNILILINLLVAKNGMARGSGYGKSVVVNFSFAFEPPKLSSSLSQPRFILKLILLHNNLNHISRITNFRPLSQCKSELDQQMDQKWQGEKRGDRNKVRQ